MSRMLLAPGRYVQGVGAMDEIGSHAGLLGARAMVEAAVWAADALGRSYLGISDI